MGSFPGTVAIIGGWRCVQYDGIVAMAAGRQFGRGRGVNSMMVVLLAAGIGFLLAGLVAIGFGIPINEFGFGNTLILAGTVAASTGMLLLGLWTAVKELKNIAQRLGSGAHAGTTPELAVSNAASRGPAEDQPAADDAGHAESAAQSAGPSPPPWLEQAASRDRVPNVVPTGPEPVEGAPAVKPRRNLLFSSSSRKERERAQLRPTDPSAADLQPAPVAAPPAPETGGAPAVTFDDAWPRPERARAADAPLPRRGGRAPSTFAEANAGADSHPPAARSEDQPPVTVLKSGVVDGMAYSLYSDGSIEAQMPEGMMRFASIDTSTTVPERRLYFQRSQSKNKAPLFLSRRQ
jgi:hypothetical protein